MTTTPETTTSSTSSHMNAALPSAPWGQDPRVAIDTYIVYPTGYDEFTNRQKPEWRLRVTNEGDAGWCIRPGYTAYRAKLNDDGIWVSNSDSTRSRDHKRLHWSLDKAMKIALEHVDTHQWMGSTAFEADAIHRAHRTPPPEGWTTDVDGKTFPFVEDEHGFITGYGHQHKGEFAEHVNLFFKANGIDTPDDDECVAGHVSWLLVVLDKTNDETLHTETDGAPVTWTTPGAFPVTAVWHLR